MNKRANVKIDVDNVQMDKWVAQYIGLRNKLAEIEEAKKPFQKAKDQLAGLMLDFLDRTGQKSARTSEGTVTATEKNYARLPDPDAFMAYVAEHGAYELMDRRANAIACREFVEEHGALPPGVQLNIIRTVGVRAAGDRS